MWTHFMDMRSGGRTKVEPYEHIYIEAPESEARAIFYNRFKRNPDRVTCTCCGEDYSVSSHEDLAQVSGFQRGCEFDDGKYVERKGTRFALHDFATLEEYMKRPDVLFIPASHIKPEERIGKVPREGYFWSGGDD